MNDPFKTHGAFSWMELMTANPEAASTFYKDIFGWNIQPMPMPGNEKTTYHIIHVGDQHVGGIMETPEGYEGPTGWSSYVTVDDVDKAAAQAKDLGGDILFGPQDIPMIGRFAVLKDLQGGIFHIISYVTEAAECEGD